MVCKLSAVHLAKAASLMSRLDKELACLFGRQVVADCKKLKLEEVALEAELVAEGARQLIAAGNPKQQRAIVRAMDEETALTLCRWIREPNFLTCMQNCRF